MSEEGQKDTKPVYLTDDDRKEVLGLMDAVPIQIHMGQLIEHADAYKALRAKFTAPDEDEDPGG